MEEYHRKMAELHLSPCDLMSPFPLGESDRRDVTIAAAVAAALAELIQREGSARAVASLIGSTHPTISSLALGRSWPSVSFIVRLENELGRQLWSPAEQALANSGEW